LERRPFGSELSSSYCVARYPVSESVFLDPAIPLLQKPFSLDQLCRTVREHLDARG